MPNQSGSQVLNFLKNPIVLAVGVGIGAIILMSRGSSSTPDYSQSVASQSLASQQDTTVSGQNADYQTAVAQYYAQENLAAMGAITSMALGNTEGHSRDLATQTAGHSQDLATVTNAATARAVADYQFQDSVIQAAFGQSVAAGQTAAGITAAALQSSAGISQFSLQQVAQQTIARYAAATQNEQTDAALQLGLAQTGAAREVGMANANAAISQTQIAAEVAQQGLSNEAYDLETQRILGPQALQVNSQLTQALAQIQANRDTAIASTQANQAIQVAQAQASAAHPDFGTSFGSSAGSALGSVVGDVASAYGSYLLAGALL
jgi:hypothetical protein